MKTSKLLIPGLFFLLLAGVSFSQEKSEPKNDGIRPALLVIDIQNEYLPMVPEREKDVAMYMINAYIDLFREKGFPVIRVYHSDPGEGPKPGSDGFEFPSSVKILPDDPQVIKHHSSGFKQTDLEKILRDKKCNTLFICGLSAVGCALATYIEANDLEFDAFLIKGALMSHDSDYTDQIENIFGAIGYKAIEVMLANAVK